MKINAEVALIGDDEYRTGRTGKLMKIRRGAIGRVTRIRDSQSFYVKFRGHQERAFFGFELLLLLRSE